MIGLKLFEHLFFTAIRYQLSMILSQRFILKKRGFLQTLKIPTPYLLSLIQSSRSHQMSAFIAIRLPICCSTVPNGCGSTVTNAVQNIGDLIVTKILLEKQLPNPLLLPLPLHSHPIRLHLPLMMILPPC